MLFTFANQVRTIYLAREILEHIHIVQSFLRRKFLSNRQLVVQGL